MGEYGRTVEHPSTVVSHVASHFLVTGAQQKLLIFQTFKYDCTLCSSHCRYVGSPTNVTKLKSVHPAVIWILTFIKCYQLM